MDKGTDYKLALLISRVFDAPVAAAVGVFLIWSNAPATNKIPPGYLLVGLIYLLIVPILITLLLIKLGKVKNWDLTEKSDRKYPFIVFLISLLFIIGLVKFFNISPYYEKYLYLALSIAVFFGIITFLTKYKPSLHVGSWMFIVVYLSLYASPLYLLLLPLVIVIGVSRIIIKNHTIAELFIGAFIICLNLVSFYLLT